MSVLKIPTSGVECIRYYIDRQDLIVIDGIDHCWVSTDANGHVLNLRDDPDRHVSFTHLHYYRLVQSNRCVRHGGYFTEGKARARAAVKWAPLSTLPDRTARKTLAYGDALDIFIEMRNAYRRGERDDGRKVNTGDASLAWVLPEIKAELFARHEAQAGRGGQPVRMISLTCPRDFRRKLKRYVESGFDKRIFDSRAGGKKTRNRVVDIAEYTIRRDHQLRFASKNKPSITNVRNDYLAAIHALNMARTAEGLPTVTPVSRKCFDKGVKALDKFHVALGRNEEAAAHKEMNIDKRGVDVERPLARVEMDEWKVDLMVLLIDLGIWTQMTPAERKVVERARLWATIVIDVATRCILAMKLFSNAPDADSARTTLEMAMIDKTLVSEVVGAGSPWVYHGLISEVYMDSGSSFLAHDTRVALLDAGVSHIYPISGTPQLRPYVERVFRTCSMSFLSWFTGRTFSDYITKGDYDPEANASLCLDEFCRHFLRALIDIYHNTPHEGLAGETPHNAWMRLSRKYGVEQPPSDDERRHAFGIHCKARIGDKGVRFLGLHYQSRELQMIRKRLGNVQVRFRVDRFNLSRISVWDDEAWITVPTRFEFPENVSIWEWVRACEQLRRIHADNAKVRLSVMLDAINDIRAGGEAARLRAELASPVVNGEYVRHQEAKLFRGMDILDDRKEPARLLDLTRPRPEAIPLALPAPMAPGPRDAEPRYQDAKDAFETEDGTPAADDGGLGDIEFED